MERNEKLVWIGQIISLERIANSDHLSLATVVCGAGGKWRGVVRTEDFFQYNCCMVYLPDSIVPESDDMKFLASSGWRVKMRKFRGAPSEVVIMPVNYNRLGAVVDIGQDITEAMGVKKYFKPIPVQLAGKIKGIFPGIIPKTDEPNYQSNPDLVQSLHGRPYYVTEKCDGSSTTAYRDGECFGLCSRNWELYETEENAYWKVVRRYNLQTIMPPGIALQFETCGPGIQKNPQGLKEVEGYAFSGFNITEQRYLTIGELCSLCAKLNFPMARILDIGTCFDAGKVDGMGEGVYSNGKQREGVVVRSIDLERRAPISFKVINLNYED